MAYRVLYGGKLLDQLDGQIGLRHPGIVRWKGISRRTEWAKPYSLAEVYLAVLQKEME